jgi:hypothetical protein
MAKQLKCSLLKIECLSRNLSTSGGQQIIESKSSLIICKLPVPHATIKTKTKILICTSDSRNKFERNYESNCTIFWNTHTPGSDTNIVNVGNICLVEREGGTTSIQKLISSTEFCVQNTRWNRLGPGYERSHCGPLVDVNLVSYG